MGMVEFSLWIRPCGAALTIMKCTILAEQGLPHDFMARECPGERQFGLWLAR